MNIFSSNVIKETKGGPHMASEHKPPLRHNPPPHERKSMLRVEFDDSDWALLRIIFGDEDTAKGAVKAIDDAPPEARVQFIQLLNTIKEVI